MIVGFPLFTSLALVTSDAAHGAVVIAVLPAATALAAVLRAGERPGPAFWLAAVAGLARRARLRAPRGLGRRSPAPTLFLLIGTALCALGYAEGGALARELGGARTISWALVLSLPLTIPVTVVAVALTGLAAPARRLARASPTSPRSRCSSASSPGTRASPAAASRASARSSSPSRCSPSSGRRSCSASTLSPALLLAGAGVLASVVATQRARVAIMPARAGAVLHRGQRPLGHDDAAPDPRRGPRRGDPAGVDVPHGLRPCAGEGRPG